MSGRGLLVAAPTSSSGKTTVTLALARALRNAGYAVRSAKSGPDYIDPAYLAAATGHPCVTLDPFAMSPDRMASLASGTGLLLAEGAMGLFDGAPPSGRGSSAELARTLGLPVILVVNTTSVAQSIAPMIAGFLTHDPRLTVAGVILNNLGSVRHETMIRQALSGLNVPIFGAIPRQSGLVRPSRHLGLVQAREHNRLEDFIETAAAVATEHLDLAAIADTAAPLPAPQSKTLFPPLGQRIAIARDNAFAFCYPHLEADWQAAGATLHPFSPLADEEPDADADAIYLPGGYPELHAQAITRAGRFRGAMAAAASRETTIYGECGGYMVLGSALTDKRGISYPMTGLLDLETSFAKRRLHLGYRHLEAIGGPFAGAFYGHEFHYATTLRANGNSLFSAKDAEGGLLGEMGLVSGSVSGSFAHIIDQAPA